MTLSTLSPMQKTGSLRRLIKEETATAHARAEVLLWPEACWRDPKRYRLFLQVMLATHQRWGEPSARLLDRPDDVRHERALIAAIAQDLGAGASPQRRRDAAAFELTASMAWGVRYALVGAGVGAAALMKRGAPLGAHRYLTLSAHFVKKHGRRFFDALEQAHVERQEAIAGATTLFDAVIAETRTQTSHTPASVASFGVSCAPTPVS